MQPKFPLSLCIGRAAWFVAAFSVPLSVQAQQAAAPDPAQPQERQAEPSDEAPREPPVLIVTGSLDQKGVPVVPFDAIGSRDVFGPQEIRRTGARDLNDLVAYLPSLSTRPYNGGEAAAPSFSIHGLPDDGLTEYLLTLIDGVPASPMPYGWTAFSFYPLLTEQVYAIDLIRGGQAVRYSPNTVGGVLNFITTPIPDQPLGTVQSTFGSNDYASTLLSYGATGEDGFGWMLTFGDRRGSGYRDEGDFQQQSTEVKLRWQHATDSWTAAKLSYFVDEHQVPGGLTVAQFEENRFGNARPDNEFNGFRWVADVVHHAGDDHEYLEGFAWVSQTHRDLYGQRPVFGTPTTMRESVDDAYVAATGIRGQESVAFLGKENVLYWGVRAQQEWIPELSVSETPIGGGPVNDIQNSEYSLTALSAHIDDTVRPFEGLLLNAGVRAEWIPVAKGEDDIQGGEFDKDFFGLMPAVGASYEITERWALFSNWQKSFRAPQVWGFDVSSANFDQDMDFEDGNSFEVGTRVLGPAGLGGSIAWWRTDFDDVGVFYSGFYENIGRIVAEGVDFGLDWNAGDVFAALDGLSLRASYTLQDSELREGPNQGNETPYAWENKAAWSAQYLTSDLWRLALGGVYVGDSYSDEANTVAENPDGNLGLNESRTTWDTQIEKTWNTRDNSRISFAVGATNVFDEDWFVHSRGGFFGGGKVAGPPRQVYMRLSASF